MDCTQGFGTGPMLEFGFGIGLGLGMRGIEFIFGSGFQIGAQIQFRFFFYGTRARY